MSPELKNNLEEIGINCKESINKIKAEKILEKYPSYNLGELIKEKILEILMK